MVCTSGANGAHDPDFSTQCLPTVEAANASNEVSAPTSSIPEDPRADVKPNATPSTQFLVELNGQWPTIPCCWLHRELPAPASGRIPQQQEKEIAALKLQSLTFHALARKKYPDGYTSSTINYII